MLALFPIKSILKFGPIEAHFQSLSPTINWDFCSIVWSLKHLFHSHLRAQSHAPMPTVNAMNGNVFGNVINEISSFQKFEIVHFISNSLFLFEFKDRYFRLFSAFYFAYIIETHRWMDLLVFDSSLNILHLFKNSIEFFHSVVLKMINSNSCCIWKFGIEIHQFRQLVALL